MRRLCTLIMVFAVAGLGAAASPASASCASSRILVLSAFPAELTPLLARVQPADPPAEVYKGKPFFLGTLAGHDVVMALTGIGVNNASDTARKAYERFTCFAGVVFSGVSGGRTNIGDVTIPAAWTLAGGSTYPVDPGMLSVANGLDVSLERATPSGNAVCAGLLDAAAHVPTISMPSQPVIVRGGTGFTSDPFGGRTLPCVPGGGDVFGCDPCNAPVSAPPDPQTLVTNGAPFLSPFFFFDYYAAPAAPDDAAAVDMETAAAASVAAENGTPFIAFRALSDGNGDPLMLPGFPFQFFAYRQLAADNAAAVTAAFLAAYSA